MEIMDLTKAELQIMKCIWDSPTEMVLSEIVAMAKEHFGKVWAPQTVSTYLAHLVRKKFVKMEKKSNAYRYQILITKAEYFNKSMTDYCAFWGMDTVVAYLKEKECL